MENFDILEEKRTRVRQILKVIEIYCRKHMLIEVDASNLDRQSAEEIGTEIVDIFVDRLLQHQRKTPLH